MAAKSFEVKFSLKIVGRCLKQTVINIIQVTKLESKHLENTCASNYNAFGMKTVTFQTIAFVLPPITGKKLDVTLCEWRV